MTDMCIAIDELREEEREIGRSEGRSEGRIEGKIELLVDLLKENIMTLEVAAEKAGMSVEEFKEVIKSDF